MCIREVIVGLGFGILMRGVWEESVRKTMPEMDGKVRKKMMMIQSGFGLCESL